MTNENPPDLFELFEMIDEDRKDFAEEQQQKALEADQEIARQRAFKGGTYDPDKDFNRLSNNLQRVFLLLLDGQPHLTSEINAVGGAEGTRRARELAEPSWGPLQVSRTRHEVGGGRTGQWVYQLDLSSVTPHIHHKVMSKSPDREAPDGLAARRAALFKEIRDAPGYQLAQLEAVIVSWSHNPDGMNVEDIVED